MVRLKDDLCVAADQVSEVAICENRDGLHVRMKDGRVHWVPCDYGKSAWTTYQRLVDLIEDAQAHG